MPPIGQGHGKTVALLLLGPLCVWLVYRNLISPVAPTAAASPPSVAARGPSDATASGTAFAGSRDKGSAALDPAGLKALDPTLRLDLLDKSRAVEYEGGSRNIFQVYTPPPPAPVAPPMVPAAPGAQTSATPAPPPLNTPLKFYGVSERNGQKTALLTNGDEIVMGREGDVVAQRYKILHIGISSIEMEDIEGQKQGQLPLLEQ